MVTKSVLIEGVWGVKSAQGVITVAPSLEKAEKWANYKFHTAIGDCGEELVQIAPPESYEEDVAA